MGNPEFFEDPNLMVDDGDEDEIVSQRLLNEEEYDESDEEDDVLSQNLPLTEVLEDEAAIGYRMGKYYVLSGAAELGKGGQGRIYECHCDDDDKIYVAKIYRSNDKYIEQIKSINKRVMNLACRNLVHIYAEGETQDGDFYMVVMEKYQELREDFLNFELHGEDKNYRSLFRNVVKDMVEGFKVIHAFGIYHSDIKPANIMRFRDENDREHSVLIDFGGSAEVEAEKQRNGGKIARANIYSRGYQAPELLSGKVSNVSERTDIYSLGVTLVELIAGVYPYLGDMKSESASKEQREYYQRNAEEGERVSGMLLPKGLPKHMVHFFRGLLYYDTQDPENLKYRWTDSQIDSWCEYAAMGGEGYKSILAMPVGNPAVQNRERGTSSSGKGNRKIFIAYNSGGVPVTSMEDVAQMFFEHWPETVDRLSNKRDWARGFGDFGYSVVQMLNDAGDRMRRNPATANEELQKLIETYGSRELREKCKNVFCIGRKVFVDKEDFGKQLYDLLLAEDKKEYRWDDKTTLFFNREEEFGEIFRKGLLKQYLMAVDSPDAQVIDLCDELQEVFSDSHELTRYDLVNLFKVARLLKGDRSYRLSNGKVYNSGREFMDELVEIRYDASRVEELRAIMKDAIHANGETKMDFEAFRWI